MILKLGESMCDYLSPYVVFISFSAPKRPISLDRDGKCHLALDISPKRLLTCLAKALKKHGRLRPFLLRSMPRML